MAPKSNSILLWSSGIAILLFDSLVPTKFKHIPILKFSAIIRSNDFNPAIKLVFNMSNEVLKDATSFILSSQEEYPTKSDTPEILAFRRELDELAPNHLREVPKNKATSTTSVNSGSGSVNSQHAGQDDSDMPELTIFNKPQKGIFDEASYDDEGIVYDFNNLPTEVAQEPKKISEALKDDSWVEAMQEELIEAINQLLAVDQIARNRADQSEITIIFADRLPSSSHPPVISATIASEPTPVAEPTTHHISPSPEPDNETTEHIFEQPSPKHQPPSPRQETAVLQSQDPTHPYVPEARTMTVEDLLHLVPNLITKDEDAEISSKRGRNLQEEGLDEMVRNMVKNKSEVFKTPTQSKTSGEEDISHTTLEAAKTLSKVASQRSKSVDKGKRYKRRKESKGKDIDSGFEDISTGFEEVNTGFEKVNTGGLGVSTGSGPVSSARGQREGKAPMIVEETQAPKRTKEQIQQEEASLAEAIRLQTLEEEETAKQVHLDALLAKRMEEEELTEQQKQRKAQVQFEAQHYTEEDWDAIRAKLEANVELTKNVLGKELPEEDFAKKMVELVNQRKKFFAEERAKARRSKPMTQSLLRNYMMNYLKNQGTWKLTQLKKLSFEEVKEEFDKLVKQVESFVPMNIEATKAQLKRYGEELQTEISKKQRIDDKDVSVEEKVTEVKEEEPVIRTGKRKKQKARKGINVDKSPQGDSEIDEEESVEATNPTPLDTKSNIVAN
ncbi:hypothetical protein Tco_1457614 [Tanacetum coccineum]